MVTIGVNEPLSDSDNFKLVEKKLISNADDLLEYKPPSTLGNVAYCAGIVTEILVDREPWTEMEAPFDFWVVIIDKKIEVLNRRAD